MARPRPAALILALAGGFLPVCERALDAQQVSSAHVVPSPIPIAQAPAALQPAAAPNAASQPQPQGSAASAHLAKAGAAGAIGVGGRVLGNAAPLGAAQVYAYQLSSLTLLKVQTDEKGNFIFRDLPAGLYKIIANKPGFLPAVILLTRSAAKGYQFLDLQLVRRDALGQPAAARTPAAAAAAPASLANPPNPPNPPSPPNDDFWTLRASIPPDVLRDIETADGGATGEPGGPEEGSTKAAKASPSGPGQGTGAALPEGREIAASESYGSRFRAEVQAMSGVADIAQMGSGELTSGKVGLAGQLGGLQVGLTGRFMQMNADASSLSGLHGPTTMSDGQMSDVSLDLQSGSGSKITLDSINDRMVPRATFGDPVGLDHYQVSWTQALGEGSHSDFAAQYTQASNYNRLATFQPADIPDASRTWRVDGDYSTAVGDDSTLQAGFRYSELEAGIGTPTVSGNGIPTLSSFSPQASGNLTGLTAAAPGSTTPLIPDHQTVDVWSRSTMRLEPAFMVEYGLYTTLQDGSLALSPQGGLVFQLGDGWQVGGNASQRVYQDAAFTPEFLPVLYRASDLCEDGGRACYQIDISNHSNDDNSISFSALERIVGQTLQLYFSDVVFDRYESLYLVPGDRLPELRMMMTYRLSPNVKTSLETSLAKGGGGIFQGADGRTYRNQVSYLVTSVDTHLLNTATGVFVAFHHITQDLGTPGVLGVAGDPGMLSLMGGSAGASVAFDRLQLVVSQDMNVLWKLAAEWALQVNMELERDQAPYLASTDTQIHRRILGGIAVKF